MTRKALVVGINTYGSPNDLTSATRDADAVAGVLESVYRFEQVRVLRDADASEDGVDRGLGWLFQNAGPSDRLVFYFSGLGHRYERNGVVKDALVLADNRFLDDDDLLRRIEDVPAGVLTVVLDCSFGAGLETLLVLPGGQVEVAKVKRWIPPDSERLRQQRESLARARAFSPFGTSKPIGPEALAGAFRSLSLDPSPARLVPLTDPRWRALLVTPCLEDEVAIAATSQTGGLSAFTACLLNAVRRLGPNRSAIEVLQTAGHDAWRLGLRQTPIVKEPLQPEHLSLRAFLTFQPALFVRSPTPGDEADDPRNRSIAEAIRNTVEGFKEGRSMQSTMTPGQTMFGDDVGTIVNTVTPIVASILQSRSAHGAFGMQQQPYGSSPQSLWGAGQFAGHGMPGQWPYGMGGGQYGWQQLPLPFAQGGFGQHGFGQQGFGQQGFGQQPGFGQQYGLGQQGFGMPGGFGQWGGGGSLPPHELAQVVSIVTPVVASVLQTRAYQMQMGYMPRAA